MKPLVTVVIPSYNYANYVSHAIMSVMKQTLSNYEVFIVDDGSTDDTAEIVKKFIKDDNRFHYVYQDNMGVAHARNKGIALGSAPYICCLDADDAISKEFLEVCVNELEKDSLLGIAYTGLYYRKPDGDQGLSPWPGEFDYDRQLKKQNQIPTCCVYRRVMWERLGGYRQRYAPMGAGAEDAEFFLRAGALGFDAKKATEAGLFIYSWKSGRVSGNPDYQEVNWLEWHPWTKDKQHPIASLASTQGTLSHPVMQYDQPSISVIIPVGKGHESEVMNALDSLEAQTFRYWEAIVVMDGVHAHFTHDKSFDIFKKAYPFVNFIHIEDGPKGAGYARNLGATHAQASMLLFLDADDWLYPDALKEMLSAYRSEGKIVYTDYVGKAYIKPEDINKLNNRMLYYNEKTTEAVMLYKSLDYDCDLARSQPNNSKIYIWNLISSLVPKEWHNEIGGFDEQMHSWEDWDYWLRMAYSGKCFVRIAEPLLVYRFYSGGRRDIGARDNESLIKYLREKFQRIKIMPCNCGGKKSIPSIAATRSVEQTVTRQRKEVIEMKDEKLVLIEYQTLNRGQHHVVGSVTGTRYGYRARGDRFYVHMEDYKARSHEFRVVEDIKEEAEKVHKATTPERLPAHDRMSPPIVVETVEDVKPTVVVETSTEVFTEDYTDVVVDLVSEFDLSMIPGITPAIAKKLEGLNVNSYKNLIELGVDGLTTVRGIGEARANAIIAFAKEQLG